MSSGPLGSAGREAPVGQRHRPPGRAQTDLNPRTGVARVLKLRPKSCPHVDTKDRACMQKYDIWPAVRFRALEAQRPGLRNVVPVGG